MDRDRRDRDRRRRRFGGRAGGCGGESGPESGRADRGGSLRGPAPFAAAALLAVAPGAAANAQPADPGLTRVPGIEVGSVELEGVPSGCTVVLTGAGAVAGVDVRGSAPGTRETALLDPVHTVSEVHAVVLSGGSAFGLAAADGVMRFLEERGIGYPAGRFRVPIVPAAILFDLGVAGAAEGLSGASGGLPGAAADPAGSSAGNTAGDPAAAVTGQATGTPAGDPAGNAAGRSAPAATRPGPDCGYRAAAAAHGGPVARGNAGAGAGATVGKLRGRARAMKGGLGSASLEFADGLVVAALVAVNAVGDIVDPATGEVVAGVRDDEGGFADARRLLLLPPDAPAGPDADSGGASPAGGVGEVGGSLPGEVPDTAGERSAGGAGAAGPSAGEDRAGGGIRATTIGVVATNAPLTKAQATKVAAMAQDGLARTIYPAHTPSDGDTLFALSPGGGPPASAGRVGALAAEAVARAVLDAVRSAESLPGLPAARDLPAPPAADGDRPGARGPAAPGLTSLASDRPDAPRPAVPAPPLPPADGGPDDPGPAAPASPGATPVPHPAGAALDAVRSAESLPGLPAARDLPAPPAADGDRPGARGPAAPGLTSLASDRPDAPRPAVPAPPLPPADGGPDDPGPAAPASPGATPVPHPAGAALDAVRSAESLPGLPAARDLPAPPAADGDRPGARGPAAPGLTSLASDRPDAPRPAVPAPPLPPADGGPDDPGPAAPASPGATPVPHPAGAALDAVRSAESLPGLPAARDLPAPPAADRDRPGARGPAAPGLRPPASDRPDAPRPAAPPPPPPPAGGGPDAPRPTTPASPGATPLPLPAGAALVAVRSAESLPGLRAARDLPAPPAADRDRPGARGPAAPGLTSPAGDRPDARPPRRSAAPTLPGRRLPLHRAPLPRPLPPGGGDFRPGLPGGERRNAPGTGSPGGRPAPRSPRFPGCPAGPIRGISPPVRHALNRHSADIAPTFRRHSGGRANPAVRRFCGVVHN